MPGKRRAIRTFKPKIMKPARTLLPLLLAVCIRTVATAQTKIGEDYILPSPQVWSFMNYGGDSPTLSTGTVRAEIPVYTYEDPDFKLPVALVYASNGYIPNVQAGQTGLGWYLRAGGYIVRETRGIQDDAEVYVHKKVGYPIKGFYHYYRGKAKETDKILEAGSIDETRTLFGIGKAKPRYETQSDIYSFNFMGHRGKFVLTADSVAVFDTEKPAGEYSVSMTALRSGIIHIRTGDGYTFQFNDVSNYGTALAPDYSKFLHWQYHTNDGKSEFHPNGSMLPDIWMLTCVTTPAGVEMRYEYSSVLADKCKSENVRPAVTHVTHTGASSSLLKYELPENRTALLSYSMDVPYLKRIRIRDRMEIRFDYSPRAEVEKVHRFGTERPLDDVTDKLDAITVCNAEGDTIRTCRLSYVYADDIAGSNPVMFLDKVFVSGAGEYGMIYEGQDADGRFTIPFPCHGTTSIDYWGYSNAPANYDLERFLDDFSEPTRTQAPRKTSRSADAAFAVRGMLKRLTYPTRGYTVYEYGPHTYTSRIARRTDGSARFETNDWGAGEAGGVCLLSVSDYDTDHSLLKRRTYRYRGTLLHHPQFESNYDAVEKTGKWTQQNRIVSGADLSSYAIGDYHVQYYDVREILPDGGQVWYTFSSYQNAPELFPELKPEETLSAGLDYLVTSDVVQRELKPHYIPSRQGRLLRKEFLTANDVCVRAESYRYGNVPALYTEGVERAGDLFYVQRTYLQNYPLLEIDVLENAQNVSETRITRQLFTYNDYKQVRNLRMIGSAGEQIDRTVYYAADIPQEERSSELQAHLAQRHRGAVLREERRVDGVLMELNTYAYRMLYQDSLNCEPSNSAMIPLFNRKFPVLHEIRSGQYPVDEENLPLVLRYDEYDVQGHAMQTTGRDGIPTCYIWGYHGMYPVAEIRNITYPRLNGKWTPYYQTPLAGELPSASENELRRRPHYRSIRTFRYEPMVGVVETTDPAGRKTTYEYNASGMLKAVRDHEGNLLQSYNYSTEK